MERKAQTFIHFSSSSATFADNPRSVLLFSADTPLASPSNNLISIQLDSITLNKIIANAEELGKVVKKINFRDVNGFEKLVRGESTKFSFFVDEGSSVCDAKCDVSCKAEAPPTAPPTPRIIVTKPPPTTTTTTTRTTTTRKPFVTRKQSTTGPTYLPPIGLNFKDDGITRPTTATAVRTTTETTTRRTFPVIQGTTQRETQKPFVSTTTTTQRTTRPTVAVSRPRTSTPGPAYLPLAKITTERRSTVTERSYPPATWPSTSRVYTQTFPTWSAPIRRVTPPTAGIIVTASPKYEYRAPSNSLIYADEAE